MHSVLNIFYYAFTKVKTCLFPQTLQQHSIDQSNSAKGVQDLHNGVGFRLLILHNFREPELCEITKEAQGHPYCNAAKN